MFGNIPLNNNILLKLQVTNPLINLWENQDISIAENNAEVTLLYQSEKREHDISTADKNLRRINEDYPATISKLSDH